MSQFENEFSNFPEQLIIRHNYKNIDDNIASIINQINSLRSQGLYGQASRIIENNKDILPQYVVDAVTFRTWEEEIYNAQKYTKQQQQSIYFEEDELEVLEYIIEGDVWLGGRIDEKKLNDYVFIRYGDGDTGSIGKNFPLNKEVYKNGEQLENDDSTINPNEEYRYINIDIKNTYFIAYVIIDGIVMNGIDTTTFSGKYDYSYSRKDVVDLDTKVRTITFTITPEKDGRLKDYNECTKTIIIKPTTL